MAFLKKFLIDVNFLCFIWFQINIIQIKSEKPLIFNQLRQTFDEAIKSCKKCSILIACPPDSPEEIDFNLKESMTKRGVFVKNVYSTPEQIEELHEPECKDDYEASVVFNEYKVSFQTGFEVYFDKNVIDSRTLYGAGFNVYKSIAEFKASKKLRNKLKRLISNVSFKRQPVIESPFSDEKKSQRGSDKETKDEAEGNETEGNDSDNEAKMNPEKSLELFWIPIFEFLFEIKGGSPTNITYKSSIGKLSLEGGCSEYAIEKELYEYNDDINLKSFYDKNNQVEMFKALNFPVPVSESSNDVPCGQEYGCLKLYQPIPYYYYHSKASRLATCSAVNTFPIWESIVDASLKKVDQYLYAVSQVYGSNISITTGVSEFLDYPKFRKMKNHLRKTMYLDPSRDKIPVPKIMYKMVVFQNVENYAVVIVTHNNPSATVLEAVCKLDDDLLHSWKSIYNHSPKSGWTYPCPYNQDVLDQLGIIRNRSNDLAYHKFLLHRFPNLNDNGKIISYEDRKPKVDQEVKELFKDF